MEKRKSQLEHGQPMEQTRGIFCTCESGVARCQSEHQCHFCRCSKRIARANELASCQSNLYNS